ncbi:MAG: isoamylase [Desulfomonilaceae bacterium]|nr:isoamylase [Desulfomonilaceae bacterium]
MNGWITEEGSDYPFGVTFIPEEDAYNFALYSKNATGVVLNLYEHVNAMNPVYSFHFDYLKNKSGRVWHCRIPARLVGPARYYAYQVHGLFAPDRGLRFDPQKLLLDPCARAVGFPRRFSRQAAKVKGTNMGRAPLGVLPISRRAYDWSGDRIPKHTHDTIVYEMHVRGFTRRPNSGVEPDEQGTFTGLVRKIPYLKELGVTVLELMPVFQFDPLEGNYWGYMPLSFFALHHLYAAAQDHDRRVDEFREMVKALHQADMEVILDVVYNHTTEEDENGPTYSFRGIDNTTYYLLGEDRSTYRDDAGTGNVIRAGHPHVRNMILESLRYWVTEMHVDGFRFDLASLLTRGTDGTIDENAPPIIAAIRSDPSLAHCRLIAEAWDVSSYQLGRCFPATTWLQWNGQYRDQVRRFLKGDPGLVPDIMRRIYGSDDLFPDSMEESYHAYQSVNYVTSHDGFTLYDLVSYNSKHNEANGLDNTDGVDDNFSWNCGREGDQGVPADVLNLRRRQIKNACCLLMLSNGTPMIHAGDEFMHTQGGNNNPFNQDNETTWLDWDLLERNGDMFRFFKLMIAFRKDHPSIGRSRYWRDDITWYGVGSAPDLSHESRSLAYCLHGSSRQDNDIYVMINAYWEDLVFTIQDGSIGEWSRVVDTGLESPDDIVEQGCEPVMRSMKYSVKPRSVVVLLRK